MRSYIAILVVAVILFSVGAVAQQQAAQQQITPEQSLSVLSQAASMFKGTLQEHMLIQQSEQTIAAALAIYRQYVP